MSRLGVNVGNVALKSPLILASGTCNFGRELSEYYDLSILGGLSSKGLTIKPRQGMTRADDELFDEVYQEYASENVDNSFYQMDTGLTPERYHIMLEGWYDVMGLDKETGLPRISSFEKNDMADVAERLINEYGINLPE